MTALKKQFFNFVLIFFMLFSCSTKKDSGNTNTTITTISDTTKNEKKPDSTIQVKEDFTQLTKADEEREDKTHMDMSYFPSNYALDKARNKNLQLLIRTIYSRPHKRDRPVIFGDSGVLVPYGKLWRLGANESTEIEFIKPVSINGKKLNAGRYTIFAIPNKKTWTIIFNKNLYTWGEYNYDPNNDVLRTEAIVTKRTSTLETFLIYFQKTDQGCNLIMTWDTELASLPISIM